MVQVDIIQNNINIPQELLTNKRHLTDDEIAILKANSNHNTDETWNNFYVDNSPNGFDPSLINNSYFSGYIILGKLRKTMLSYNDLHLECCIRNSKLNDVVTGDDDVIYNIAYFDNYRIGNRVILFNIQELCCTKHSKFGNGILKEGEPEEHRIWIGVANENDGRRILPFESMIPADAYLWSHYRNDNELLERFVELTEYGQSKELNTYGIIENDCVIKNSNIIKDSKICEATYIKGAFKLKNITILSSESEHTQIGEGVELVNGILGYGCRVFYQAIAVRFVIGRNCQVKYGARLLNSVLGDNSTVSCCEILNNLIFPFHEQHHNSSFLIASTVMGQSNIASGATIGSNHNSRSPDGEIFAKRGFWPGLCSDFKHNSRFASFTLVSKGSYQYELDIPYPFALVSPGQNGDNAIHIIPAWWFMYDMFAITRNKIKFSKRDKRLKWVQQIEVDPLAPDTMQEIITALERLINLTADYLISTNNEAMEGANTPEEKFAAARSYMHLNPRATFTLSDPICQKKYGATIYKPVRAYKTYRKIVKYFATMTLIDFVKALKFDSLSLDLILRIRKLPLFTEWENVGGQIIPSKMIQDLFCAIKNGTINTWDAVHQYYKMCECAYDQYKVRYALYLLEWLYSRPIEDFTIELFADVVKDVKAVTQEIFTESVISRRKDYTNYYRLMVYHDEKEMENVIGSLESNSFLKDLKISTEQINSDIEKIFKDLTDIETIE